MCTLKWRYLIPLVLVALVFYADAGCAPKTPETVVFPDENLEKAVRDALDKAAGEAITPAEMAELTELITSHQGITDLSGIEYGTNLTLLDFGSNQISDISPLASLTNLTFLRLRFNQISDISSLDSLTNVERLGLNNNRISDISPLNSLSNLVELKLQFNQISDLSPLVENSGLGERDMLQLRNNNLDLSESSEDLKNIRKLEARGVRIDY